jgi:hypothetical protein
MASEDSVENLFLRDSPVLAVAIDGVGKVDELYEPFDGPLPPLIHKVDHGREDLVVRYTRRKAHVALEERDDDVTQDTPIRNPQNEHALISRFGKDAARSELLRSHFEEPPSLPVLVQKELRFDEVAKCSSWVTLERHADAAFAFNEAG